MVIVIINFIPNHSFEGYFDASIFRCRYLRRRPSPSPRPIGKCHSEHSIRDFDGYHFCPIKYHHIYRSKIRSCTSPDHQGAQASPQTYRSFKSSARSDIFRWFEGSPHLSHVSFSLLGFAHDCFF